jgi:hypothetical protein
MSSALVRFGIPAIALALVVLLALGTWAAERAHGATVTDARGRAVAMGAAALGWLALLGVVARSGALKHFGLPPPLMLVFAATVGLALWLALSSRGKTLALELPLSALVGFQAFRLPLELVMHRAALDGLMPNVMTYTGYNFDILSGASALLLGVALLARPLPRWLVAAWTCLAMGLLLAISVIAILATPLFRAFGDGELNVWVTDFPYVWMVVMVASALLGHVLVIRRLLHERRADAGTTT